MRLIHTPDTVSHKRRETTSGDKKSNSTLQENIPAFISDTGTTEGLEQTYQIFLNSQDVTATINPNTDTINDGSDDYTIENAIKKTNHYELRCIKVL